MTINNLTELWKKGELEAGWYYIEIDAPFEQKIKDISYYSSNTFDIEVDGNYIIDVLAPVPSYEEWQTTLRYNKALDRDINNIIEMNGALGRKLFAFSELLKECSLLLIKQQANDEVEHKESVELVLRIEEVLK